MKMNSIKELYGKRILEVRIMSYNFKIKKICEILALYLMVDGNKWFSFSCIDGISKIVKLKDEPKIELLEFIKNEIAYPINAIPNEYIGYKINTIKEYLWQGRLDESCGFYFELESQKSFSLIENNDCLTIVKGLIFRDGYILK